MNRVHGLWQRVHGAQAIVVPPQNTVLLATNFVIPLIVGTGSYAVLQGCTADGIRIIEPA